MTITINISMIVKPLPRRGNIRNFSHRSDVWSIQLTRYFTRVSIRAQPLRCTTFLCGGYAVVSPTTFVCVRHIFKPYLLFFLRPIQEAPLWANRTLLASFVSCRKQLIFQGLHPINQHGDFAQIWVNTDVKSHTFYSQGQQNWHNRHAGIITANKLTCFCKEAAICKTILMYFGFFCQAYVKADKQPVF